MAGGTRILGVADLRRLLTLEDTIELQRAAFAAQARGQTAAAPNAWLTLPGDRRGWLKILAGYDERSGALGVKVLARFPELASGQNLGSLLMLFDDTNGTPLAVMDAVYVTALRTAAGAAIATEALARPDSTSIGMVGTGELAWYSVLSHQLLCPGLRELKVYSRSPERRAAFCARVNEETALTATPVDTVADAVAGTDVVITATNAPEPVLLAEHLEAGQHVTAIGIRYEIAADALARSYVVGDGREEAVADGKFSTAIAAGLVTADDLGAEIGEVTEGMRPGRTSDDQITLFDSSGVAIQDVVCARHVWLAAEEAGAGAVVQIGDTTPTD
jgi:ornithine cyclodeaminase/alanine dehydrogenase-like protein (mu-crystallin family)